MFRLRHEGSSRAPVPLAPARRYTIGRSAEADLSIPEDTSLSRLQAELVFRGPGWVLVNRSQHGSYVGGARVDGERLLSPGDVVQVGSTHLVYEADTQGAKPASVPGP